MEDRAVAARGVARGVRRHSTTAIASVVLTLCGLRLLVATQAAWAAIRVNLRETTESYRELGFDPPPLDIFVPYAWWLLAAALSALAVGLALAVRSRKAPLITVIAMIVTLAETGYYVFAIVPVRRIGTLALMRSSGDSSFGLVVCVLWLLGYVGISLYLRAPSTQEEFGDGRSLVA